MLSSEKEILERLRQSVIDYDADAAKRLALEAVKAGVPLQKALDEGLAKGVKEVGERFERMEVFLPQLFLAGEAMEAGTKVLEEEIHKRGMTIATKGTVVIGTVQGDIHDIGKNIIAAFFKAGGFRVIDLGKDVPVGKFIESAEAEKADVVALSALISTTKIEQREFIEELKRRGLREKFIVMVGGAPITDEWSYAIGADGYAKDGVEAVKMVEQIFEKRKKR
jgi:trimethylamine corrinoid protein